METNRTSILEHLTVEDAEARFLLDGRETQIGGDAFTPSLRALKELHSEVWAEIEAHQAAVSGRPSILSRIGALGKRLFPGFGSKRFFFSSATPQIPSGMSHNSPPQSVTSGSGVGNAMIEAIFADRTGVRVVWGQPSSEFGGGERKEMAHLITLTFPLDSEIGRRLQTCYAELDKLGYTVVGMGKLVAEGGTNDGGETRAREKAISIATEAGGEQLASDVENHMPSRPTPASGAQEVKNSAAAGREPLIGNNPCDPEVAPKYVIMRLHRASPDNPARGLVSPVDAPGDPEILNAPERLLRALTAASHAGIEEKDRLSFLRCLRTEEGLKIVDVGFGVKAESEREPERWDDAKGWWESKGNALAELSRPPSHVTRPGEPGATPTPNRHFEPGRAPLRTGPAPTPG